MKKISILCVSLAFLLCFSSIGLNAQNNGTSFYVAAGVVTDDSFSFDPFFWTAGLGFDIHLGELFMISPEGYIQVHNFEFGSFYLVPSVMLNVKLSSFFVGGGITKMWLLGSDIEGSISSDFLLKINAGFNGANIRLAAFVIMEFDAILKKGMTVGATLGFGF